jgi:hypothetical protein
MIDIVDVSGMTTEEKWRHLDPMYARMSDLVAYYAKIMDDASVSKHSVTEVSATITLDLARKGARYRWAPSKVLRWLDMIRDDLIHRDLLTAAADAAYRADLATQHRREEPAPPVATREHYAIEQVKRIVIAAMVEKEKGAGMAVTARRAADDLIDLLCPGVPHRRMPEPCTCLSDMADSAYDPGGPMSGQKRPPACRVHHPKKD